MASGMDRGRHGWVAFGAGASIALGVIGGLGAAEQVRPGRAPAGPDGASSRSTTGGSVRPAADMAPRASTGWGRMVDLAPPRPAEPPLPQRSPAGAAVG